MPPELRAAAGVPVGVAVLLHPHPAYGGSRFHPFVDGLFRRLPETGVSAVRFDFTSGEVVAARGDADAAIAAGAAAWPQVPLVLVGYSFGAAIAAGCVDDRIAGWYLLAPPLAMLADAAVAGDPRPKAVLVPEHDQFSPRAAVVDGLAGWKATTIATAPGADHFLGAVGPFIDAAQAWIEECIVRPK